ARVLADGPDTASPHPRSSEAVAAALLTHVSGSRRGSAVFAAAAFAVLVCRASCRRGGDRRRGFVAVRAVEPDLWLRARRAVLAAGCGVAMEPARTLSAQGRLHAGLHALEARFFVD